MRRQLSTRPFFKHRLDFDLSSYLIIALCLHRRRGSRRMAHRRVEVEARRETSCTYRQVQGRRAITIYFFSSALLALALSLCPTPIQAFPFIRNNFARHQLSVCQFHAPASSLSDDNHPTNPVASATSMDSKTTEPSSVGDAVVRATQGNVHQQLEERHGLSLRLARKEDWKIANDSSLTQLKTPWFFGIAICRNAHEKDEEVVGIISFYIAYSTWNGKILYLDQILWASKSMNMSDDLEQNLLRFLASIAVDLEFARLTWRHKDTPKWHAEGTNLPEMHGEVLTLSMDQEAMKNYVGDMVRSPTSEEKSFDTAPAVVSDCLQAVNEASTGFRLRLANASDLDTVGRLIQGLADYVKEPDSVHLGVEDYRRDGFSGSNPLFTCLLLDHVNEETGETHTCGYAFCFFGYIAGSGRFLYLEDLFLEVEYRQNGGGNLIMKTLAQICLSLECEHLYWQALDWNTAGLQFYSKIGANILDGVKTSRYCADAMKSFADKGTE